MLYLTAVLTVVALIYLGYVMIRPEDVLTERILVTGTGVCFVDLVQRLVAPVLGLRPADRGVGAARLVDVPRPRSRRTSRPARASTPCPLFLCRLLGRREPAQMDWKRYAFAFLAFNAALFVLTFGLLYAPAAPAAEPRRQGLAGGARLQGRRGRRPPGADTGGRVQHRLLVRHQHEPPALLGRAAPVVLQPARRASSG